jgi:plasmid maintenance system antidote protein VapI
VTGAEEDLRVQVRAALERTGISQAEASRRLGLSTKHTNQMITGRAPMPLQWADRILTLCGMRLVIGIQLVDTEEQP